MFVFFFKQKTAYEMRISDWSSDVCSSDLFVTAIAGQHHCHPLPRDPANEIGWYLGGIGKGFVEDARQVLDDIQAVGGLQVDLVVVGLQMTSDALGVGGLVVPRLLEADREGLHRPEIGRAAGRARVSHTGRPRWSP